MANEYGYKIYMLCPGLSESPCTRFNGTARGIDIVHQYNIFHTGGKDGRGAVFRVRFRIEVFTGIPRGPERRRANSSAWLNPLSRRRDGWTGTGIRASPSMKRMRFPIFLTMASL